MFGSGLQREWGRIVGEQDTDGARAFLEAYERYISEPKILSRQAPEQYQFLKEYVFYGREYDEQSGHGEFGDISREKQGSPRAVADFLIHKERNEQEAEKPREEQLVARILSGWPVSGSWGEPITDETSLRGWLLSFVHLGDDAPASPSPLRGDQEQAIQEYWKMMLGNDPVLNEQYLRTRSERFYRQASTALKRGDQPSALHNLSQSWEAAKELEDKRVMGIIAEAFGRIYDTLNQAGTAEEWFQVSVRHYQELGRLSFNLAYESDEEDRWNAARFLYAKAHELNQRLGDQEGVASDLFFLAAIASAQGADNEGWKLLRDSGNATLTLVNPADTKGTNRLVELLSTPKRLELFERIRYIFNYLGDKKGEAFGLHGLGVKSLSEGKLDAALTLFGQSLQLSEQLADVWGITTNQLWVGICAMYRGELDEARERFESNRVQYSAELEHDQTVGDTEGVADSLVGIGDNLLWLANVAFEQGDLNEGNSLLQQSAGCYEQLVSPATIAFRLDQFARIARIYGAYGVAQRLVDSGKDVVALMEPNHFRLR